MKAQPKQFDAANDIGEYRKAHEAERLALGSLGMNRALRNGAVERLQFAEHGRDQFRNGGLDIARRIVVYGALAYITSRIE